MNDCPSADIRDRLPDLLHERLDSAARTRILAHVNGCADCTAELALLRAMHGVLTAAPRVDIEGIVRLLPSRATARAARKRGQSRWVNWRVAASIAIVAVGGASVGTYLRIGDGGAAVAARVDSLHSARTHAAIGGAGGSMGTSASAGIAGASAAAASGVTELSTGEVLNDMSDKQLEALLEEVQHLKALPPAEPDSVMVPMPDVTDGEGR